jgi:DNA-binding CsgD family transcriptional regulator
VTPGRAGIELLEESVAVARSSPARLEEARSLIKLGEALRRRGMMTDARLGLAEGIDLAHRLGAHALLERGRRELRAAGGRPRRYAVTGRDALTPAEARVAELVAAGRTNRQAAEALFVTPKAVEYHLANAYRKLGISGRGELGRAIRPTEGGTSH